MLFFVFQKRHIKGKKHITQMEFAEYITFQKNQTFQRTSKVCYCRFL